MACKRPLSWVKISINCATYTQQMVFSKKLKLNFYDSLKLSSLFIKKPP